MKITEKINETYKLVDNVKERIGELSKELDQLNTLQQSTFAEYFQSLGLKFDELEIKDFFKKPYILLPKGKQEWYCIVPSFINFQVGFFDRREGNYNIYIINKYSRWINDIPDFMSEEIDLEEPDNIYIKDGELIFEENLLDKVRTKYGHRIKNLQKDKATIKQGCEFDLIAELIDDGNLPFIPKAVDKEDLRETKINFTSEGKYIFQGEAYKEWLKYGSLGAYWMTGAGKSFLGMHVLDSLKFDEKDKRKLLVTMTSTLVDQWKLYFEQYAPRLSEEVDVVTYNAFHKIKDKKYICVVFDENDRLPANTFSKFSTLNTKYRLGLCLDKNTLLETPSGKKKIKDIKIGDKVKSFNFSKKKEEFKPVINIWDTNKALIEIAFATPEGIKKIKCSSEHRVFVNGKFKKAKDLSSGETILFRGNKNAN